MSRMSTAELAKRKTARADAYVMGWNDAFAPLGNQNPFHPKRQESEHKKYERGFAKGYSSGLAPIPVERSERSECA